MFSPRTLSLFAVLYGTWLLLSGIWGDAQVERVLAAFAGGAMEPFSVTMSADGWALLQATKKM